MFVLLLSSLLFIAPSYAQSPSPSKTSPTPTRQITPQPTESVNDEIKERVRERIENIKQSAQKRAFWGTLKDRTNSVLVIDSVAGERRIKTDQQTVFVGTGKRELKISDLEIGNFIIALGYWQENGALNAKRIIVLTKPPKPAIQRNAVYGNVAQINEVKKTLVLNTIPKRNSVSIQISSSTIITKKADGRIKKVVFGAIEVGDRLVVVGTQKEEGGILTAKIIHVTPGLAGEKEEITPSPTKAVKPTPTPKTPRLSPTPTPGE